MGPQDGAVKRASRQIGPFDQAAEASRETAYLKREWEECPCLELRAALQLLAGSGDLSEEGGGRAGAQLQHHLRADAFPFDEETVATRGRNLDEALETN